MQKIRSIHEDIADDLVACGWSVQPSYLSDELCHRLIARFESLRANQALTPAGIGREDLNQIVPEIRKDKTYWMERGDDADMLFLKEMEKLRLDLNRDLFMGLFEYEAHYALYPAGGFYKKHIDALKGEKNRLVSTVLYLNEEWQPGDGGELALYDPEDIKTRIHTVEPRLGTCVFFLSEDIPHEVIPALKPRKSIAGWFRCNATHTDKVDPLR